MKLLIAFGILFLPIAGLAHGGGLDASGCHHDRKRGGYHCHNGNPQPQSIYRAPEPVYVAQSIYSASSSIPDFDYKLQITQKLLTALGYDLGTADGILGSKTRQAISSFEKTSGLSETGQVSDALIDTLIAKLAK